MKSTIHYEAARMASCRTLVLVLLGFSTLFLSGQSYGQAANPYNFLPNPDFELQNVTQPSGYPNNIAGYNSQYDEVTGWKATGAYASGALIPYGEPTYYATNAPTGSASNPFTSSATNVNGSPFQPYNYNPALHNGALSIVATQIGTSSPYYVPQYVTPTSSLTLAIGTYYGSFQAYRSSANSNSVRLGMELTDTAPAGMYPAFRANPTSFQSPGTVTNSAWTRVSGQIPITQAGTWYAVIGNLSPDGPGTVVRYYIDEVELYKIPTAGPPASCSGGSVTIGEGNPIPGATYEWRRNGSTSVVSFSTTTPLTSVNITDTYTLKVTLPDQTTYSTQVAVTGCNPSPAISGPTSICAGQSATYTANNSNVTWQASPASLFSTTSGSGQTFTPSTVAGASGQGTITAQFTSLTGSPIVTQSVQVLAVPGEVILSENVEEVQCFEKREFFNIDNFNSTYTYTFQAYGVTVIEQTHPAAPASPRSEFQVKWNGNSTGGYFYITVSNGSCGGTTSGPFYANGDYCVGGDPQRVAAGSAETTASPNPANESLHLPQQASALVLTDRYGNVVQQLKKATQLDVSTVPAGLYNLRMQVDGKVVNQRIQIQH